MRSGGLDMTGGARPRAGRLVWRDYFAGGLARRPGGRAGAVGAAGRMSWLLAALPILDVALAQVQARWDPQVGPVSLAQAYHGAVLAGLAAILVSRLGSFPGGNRFLLIAASAFAGSVAVSLAVGLAGGDLVLEDLVAGLQVGYWLVLWPTAFVVCRTGADCRRVLLGIALAGAYAAVSVICFYFLGGQDASPYPGVAASAGGLRTAKGLGGILITGALTAAWLSRSRSKLPGTTAVVLCISALFLTYQRAGLAAMVLALAWLAGWYALSGRKKPDSAWAGRLLLAAAVTLTVILAVIGFSDLRERWKDLPDPEKAGSARVAFWRVALEHYETLSPAEKIFGIRYAALVNAMEDLRGSRIHTHSDVLDVLVMFGLLGLVCWLVTHTAILQIIWRSRHAPSVLAVSLATYLVMLSEGLLTGQVFAPHVMGLYLVALVCWSRLAGRRPDSAHIDADPPRRRPRVTGPLESGQGGWPA